MSRLRITATECKHKEIDRTFKEQFMNDINDQTTTVQTIREVTVLKDMSEVTSKHILL